MPVTRKVFPDDRLLAEGAAEKMVALLNEALALHDFASLVLSGGSTPRNVYRILGDRYHAWVPWERVHFFWGDERCVPPEDAQSNFRMAREELLDKLRIPSGNIHRIRGEKDPAVAAVEYEQELRNVVGGGDGLPACDLVLLGLGDDGHTASLFPGTAAVAERIKLVTDVFVPELNAHRITITFPAINSAHTVLFLVSGRSKAATLKGVLEDRNQSFPATQVNPRSGNLLWFLDEGAASQLRSPQSSNSQL